MTEENQKPLSFSRRAFLVLANQISFTKSRSCERKKWS